MLIFSTAHIEGELRRGKGHFDTATVCFEWLIDSGLVGSTHFHSSHPHPRGPFLGGVPRGQKMLKRNLPRVIYHQVY